MSRSLLAGLIGALLCACGSSDGGGQGTSDSGCEPSCGDAGAAGSGGGAGTDAGGGDAGAAGGGGAEGCVDIVLSPSALTQPNAFFPHADALPSGLFRTSGGLRIAWMAYRWYPDASVPPFLENTVPVLIVSEYDATSGQVETHVEYSVFPEKITTKDGGLFSFAARSDDSFALGYAYTENGQRPERVMLGRVGDVGQSKTVQIPVAGDPLQIATQTAAAWDGEAFALHAYGAPPQFSLHVARVDPQGNVLLPFTQYGLTANVGYGEHGHKTATNVVSGRTLVFDADGSRLLSGHERSGASVSWATAQALEVKPKGTPTAGAGWPALTVDDGGGAWLAWNQATTTINGAVLAVTHVGPNGVPENYFTAEPPADDPGGLVTHAMITRGAGAWVASATGFRIYGFDVAPAGVGAPVPIVDSKSAPVLDVRQLTAFDYENETWLGFTEQHQGYARVIRVVKVKAGCVYPPAFGAAM